MEAIHELELPFILAIQQMGSWLVVPMKLITDLGSEQFFIMLMPIILWCVDYPIGLRMGIMLMTSAQANSFLKLAFHSSRPFWFSNQVNAYVLEESFGAPSGHAMNTLSVLGTIAVWFHKRWLTISMVILILLVGFSRLYLGMHFLTDVVIGWVIAILLVLLVIKLEKPILNWLLPKRLSFQILVVLFSTTLWVGLGMLLLVFFTNYSLPGEWVNNALAATGFEPSPFNPEGIYTNAGIWTGVGIGGFWLKSKGGYKTNGNFQQVLFRIVIGMSGTLLLWRGLGAFFPDGIDWVSSLLRLFRYFLVGFWVTAGAPWVFIRASLARKSMS